MKILFPSSTASPTSPPYDIFQQTAGPVTLTILVHADSRIVKLMTGLHGGFGQYPGPGGIKGVDLGFEVNNPIGHWPTCG